MPKPLRVLIVEDSEDDAYLILDEIERGGYSPVSMRVDTREALAAALGEGVWDLVIADYTLPHFSGPEALELVRESGVDLPVLIVSGKVGEDTVVDLMKAGANDYVMKSNLKRLAPAVERETREAEQRRLRKKAEDALKASEEKLRRIFDSVGDIVGVSDLQGRLLEVNRRAVETFLLSPDNLQDGISWIQLMPDREHESALENMQRIPREGLVQGLEYMFLRRDGTEFPGELSASVLKDASGKPVGFVGVIRDISERRKMQEQLILQDRLASIGQLASGIAHELNNPLTGVIGFSEILLQRTDLPDAARQDLKIINDEAQRTAQIVKGLLTFARKQKTEKEPVDVHQVIEGVLALRAYEHRVTNIEVRPRFISDPPKIVGNVAQLQQVFINIIVNAEQSMLEAHSKGILTIRTEEAGNALRISFADDGPGINPENMNRLFTPFFTTKGVGKGTGLGLSICHGIVTEHGGRIHAQSSPGKGATFIIDLPIGN